jgi:hypothetical protein
VPSPNLDRVRAVLCLVNRERSPRRALRPTQAAGRPGPQRQHGRRVLRTRRAGGAAGADARAGYDPHRSGTRSREHRPARWLSTPRAVVIPDACPATAPTSSTTTATRRRRVRRLRLMGGGLTAASTRRTSASSSAVAELPG